MPKIIIATDAWFPQVNGVVRCIDDLIKGLKKNGFEIIVVHPGMFFSIPFLFYPEIRISFFCKNKIRKIIKKENPDYIHIVTEGPIGLACRKVCLDKKIRFTTANHTNFQTYMSYYLGKANLFSELAYKYLKWFHKAGAKTMVITEGLKQNLEKRGFLNVAVWPLGVDTDFFKRNEISDAKEKYKLKYPIFVYFGRIAKEKNVEEYLKCRLPGTKLVIGDGPLKNSLEKKYGKENMFLGYKKGQELIDLLSVCDVFVLPSFTDTFPLAIIEAFSCKIPVACHNVMDLKYLVLKDVGVLSENLEEAANECLKLSKDACRKYALKFSLEESTKKFMENIVKTR